MGPRDVSSWRTRIGLMLVGLVVAAGCADKSGEIGLKRLQARAAYERGVADLREGKTAPGLSALREAAALDPETPLYHIALGQWLLDMKQRPAREEAIVEFRRAVKLDPTNPEAHHNLGVALAESSRWKEAIVQYRAALAIATFTRADIGHHNLAWALYNLGRFQEAEESARLAVRLDPAFPPHHYMLGLVLVKRERTEDAKAAFRQARELAPDSPVGLAAAEHLKALGDGG
jgi:tetratricopeptide (TPR) repeat protein